MSEAWKGEGVDPLHPVKFGRKARAWLTRRIFRHLFEPLPTSSSLPDVKPKFKDPYETWNLGVARDLVLLFLETPMRYVEWKDVDEFQGARFSTGAWEFKDSAIDADLPERIRTIDRAYDEASLQTLDDWLLADIANKLTYAGDAGGVPRLLPDVRSLRQTRAKERRLLRRCPCGERFRADKSSAVNCDACRARKREELEAGRERRRNDRRARGGQ